MAGSNMPEAELTITPELVERLLCAQHPDLADQPIEPLANGWDNVMFRLGTELVVRLPRREMSAGLVVNEQVWLPTLAPTLPRPIPAPVRVGQAGEGYPWAWSVLPWLPGRALGPPPHDVVDLAEELGAFLAALHQPAPDDAPANPYRGGSLSTRHEVTSDRIRSMAGSPGAEAIATCWARATALPSWPAPPVWLHGDLHPLNLLVEDRRLAAVIDFGDITSGDPANDLAVAWMLFGPAEREVFRAAAGPSGRPIDDADWGRALGWALSLSLMFLANSADNPAMARIGRHTLDAVLSDPTLAEENSHDHRS